MEKVVKSANGQWSLVDDEVEKTSPKEEQQIIDIKRRELPARSKPIADKIRDIKQQNTPPREPSTNEIVERKKKEYASSLAMSESPTAEETLEKSRLMSPRGTDLDMPKNPQLGEWAMRSRPSARPAGVDEKGKPQWEWGGKLSRDADGKLVREGGYIDDPSKGQGRSGEAIGTSQVQSAAQLHKHPLLALAGKNEKMRNEIINHIQNATAAHEIQHDILGHMSQQLEFTGDTSKDKGDPKQRHLAKHLIAAAKLDPHEAHLLNAALSSAQSNGINLYDHPQEAIAHVAESLHGGPIQRAFQWQKVRDQLPGETVHGFSSRMKAIHGKIQGAMDGLSKDKAVQVPNNTEYMKAIHGAGHGSVDNEDGTFMPSHEFLNSRPQYGGHKFQDLKAGYVAHAAPLAQQPVKKSVSWSVAAGLQPSSEQWEAAAAQMLGLPTDTATAEQLAKRAEAQWQNAIADSFKQLSAPVETQKPDWGRGPVDQSDESKLTEEERRIRAIPVSPDAMKV